MRSPPTPSWPGWSVPPRGLLLTKVGLLVCPFEMHPFGGRLDEEVADEVTAVLSWTERGERVSVGEGPEPGVSPPDPPAPDTSGGSSPSSSLWGSCL